MLEPLPPLRGGAGGPALCVRGASVALADGEPGVGLSPGRRCPRSSAIVSSCARSRGDGHLETGRVPPRVPEALRGGELQGAFTACCEVVVK